MSTITDSRAAVDELTRSMVEVDAAAARAAVIGAIAFEVIKQFATLLFSNALSSPAAAAFGPIIGIMVMLFFGGW